MAWRERGYRGVVALSLALTGSLAQAGPYSAMYVFGDSLSDVGNDALISGTAIPLKPVFTDGTSTGRFTNGQNYIDGLAGYLGLSVAPSLAGGTNYAYGGARVNGITPDLVPLGGKSFSQQIGTYVTSLSAAADPNALYVLWIGSNDISDGIRARIGGDPTAIGTAVGTTLNAIGGAITTLSGLGARHFLVPNLPNLSLTPGIRFAGSSDLSALAGGVSALFNANLSGLLSASAFTALDINTLDVFSAQTDITNDPASYGFTDVSSACYTGEPDGSARPGWGTPTVCADPTGYMYFDYQHPSAQLHARLAQLAFSAVVPEPDSLALLFASLGLMGVMARRRR